MSKVKRYINNLKYEFLVAVFFVLVRLPDLGNEIFNTDVWKWKTRIFNFGSGIATFDFVQTLQRYHPGVTLMWLGSIGVKLNSFYYKIILGITPPDNDVTSILTLHFFQKLAIVIALAFTVASIFYVLRKVFSLSYGVVFVTLLVFEPFYIALTRVIHLEGLLSTFMLASFVWLYYYLNNLDLFSFKLKNKRVLFVSAMFASLAFLTKTSSLFLLLFVPLVIYINFYLSTNSILKIVKPFISTFGLWFLFSVIVYFALWPALWVAPGNVLNSLLSGIFETGIEEGHIQYYFGNLVQDPGYTFYPVVFFARSSMYLIIGLLGYYLIRKKQLYVHKRFIFYSLLFALLYAVEMSIPSKKLDRYLLPTIVGVLPVAAVFYTWIVDSLSSKINVKYVYIFLFLPLVCSTIKIHPDYFSYYSPFAGGLENGIYIIEPKWLIGKNEIVSYFENKLQNDEYSSFAKEEAFDTLFAEYDLENRLVVGFQEKYYTQIHPFIHEIGARAVIKDLTPHAKVATFFVYPVWDDDSFSEDRFKIEYVDSIYVRGVPTYNVYKRLGD